MDADTIEVEKSTLMDVDAAGEGAQDQSSYHARLVPGSSRGVCLAYGFPLLLQALPQEEAGF